jgi:hypothetical protein
MSQNRWDAIEAGMVRPDSVYRNRIGVRTDLSKHLDAIILAGNVPTLENNYNYLFLNELNELQELM